jgi:phosphoribosylanthranilate isomerase
MTLVEQHEVGHVGATTLAVKVCGIRQPEHALVAALAGADMVGVVFAPSRRQISSDTARTISLALDTLPTRPALTGVFVNESTERMLETAAHVGLDVLQLSGDETPEQVRECASRYPVIKALRFPADMPALDALGLMQPYADIAGVRLLLDTYRPGEYGGTGERVDWSLASQLAAQVPLVLAGGLNPGNVAEAITSVGPSAVDVSSGVELDGVKDSDLIREFVYAARTAARKG